NVVRNSDGSLAWQSEIRRETKGGVEDKMYRRLEDQTVLSYSLGGEHHLGKLWVDWNAAYSKASEDRPNERYISLRVKDAAIRPLLADTRKPNISVTDNSVSDLSSNYDFKELTEEFQMTEDIDKRGSLKFTLPLGSQGENSLLS